MSDSAQSGGAATAQPTRFIVSRPSIGSVLARILLTACYATAWIVSRLGRLIVRRTRRPADRLLVVGTFHNPGWFRAHLDPLARCGVEEVVLVTDRAHEESTRLRFACPPPLAARVLGRAMAKLVWMFLAGLRYRSDMCIGFHIFPGAVTALVVARLLGRSACYQMTGGPIEVIGGGVHNENPLMQRLGRPSVLLERLALAVVREFDLVVVRGTGARRFLADRGIVEQVAVIPGSVGEEYFSGGNVRCYDLVFIGRLTDIKQPLQFVEVVGALRQSLPSIRAVIVGDGPLRGEVREAAIRLGVSDAIEIMGQVSNVDRILTRAKVFVLTSRSEGLSIAMVEAMAAGVVPVVADVGDLADLVRHGDNGYLIGPNDVDAFSAQVLRLLDDQPLRARCSRAAVAAARHYHQVDVVAERWRESLRALIGGADLKVTRQDRQGQRQSRGSSNNRGPAPNPAQ